MTKNISIIAAEFDSDYAGILVYVIINGVKHLCGEQLVERLDGFRRAGVGDDDAGDCFTVIDDKENPQLDSEEQKIFDDIIGAGMEMLRADEDGYIKPENRTVGSWRGERQSTHDKLWKGDYYRVNSL